MTPEQLERCQKLASSSVVGADIKALLDELKDRAWWERTALHWQTKAQERQKALEQARDYLQGEFHAEALGVLDDALKGSPDQPPREQT